MSRLYRQVLWALLFGTMCCGGPLTIGAAVAQDDNDGSVAEEKTDAEKNADEADDPKVFTYPDQELGEETPGNNSVEPREVSPKQKQALKRRAGERIGSAPSGVAVILGMHIQESDNERAKVVRVAPASAAFDAGIRQGDEILSFAGFKANTYRDWIDGMRRMTTNAAEGESLPIVFMRADKRLDLRVKVPTSNVIPKLPSKEISPPQQAFPGQPGQGVIPAPGQPGLPLGGGGDNVLIADTFGNGFGDPNGGVTERAIAEIFKLNTPMRDPAANNAGGADSRTTRARDQALQDAANNQDAGARIGLAGFRNDANGLFVMLDVGRLEPGTYTVGIDDPGVIGAGGNFPDGGLPESGVNRPTNLPANRRDSGQLGNPGRQVQPPADEPPVVPQSDVAPGSTPSNRPTDRALPAERRGEPQGRFENSGIPRTVLAQVIESPTDTPATGQPQPLDTPPTGNPAPLDTPPTGQTRESGATPTGLPRVDAREELNNDGTGSVAGLTSGRAGPAVPIGTLTVDQSGTGRLQQVVEAVRVEDIVGQAVVIYAQNVPPGRTLPPNLDNTVDPAAGAVSPGDAQAGRGARGTAAPPPGVTDDATRSAALNKAPEPAQGTTSFGANVPVAAGVIRMMSEIEPNGNVPAGGANTPLPNPRSPRDVPQGAGVPATPNRPAIR